MAEYLYILCPVGVLALMLLLGLSIAIPRFRKFRAGMCLLCPVLLSVLACVWVADLLWLYGKFRRVNHAYLELRLDRIRKEELVKLIGCPPDRVITSRPDPTKPKYDMIRLVYYIRVPFMRTSAAFHFYGHWDDVCFKVDPQPGDIPPLVPWLTP